MITFNTKGIDFEMTDKVEVTPIIYIDRRIIADGKTE
jgi:hypothetical protein